MTRALAAAFTLALALTACIRPDVPAPPAQPTLVMKAYDAPEGQGPELANVLKNLLYRGDNQPRAGQVSISPGGQLLVAAPAEFHPGVEEVLVRMKAAPQKAPPRIRLIAWLLLGERSAEAAGEVPKEIAPIITDLQAQQGPLKITLLERLQLDTQSGAVAEVHGLAAQLRGDAQIRGDGVVSRLKLEMKGGMVDVATVLPLGKPIVLGQAGAELPERMRNQLAPSRDPVAVYYVVMADVAK